MRGPEVTRIARTKPGRFNFTSNFDPSLNRSGDVAFTAELDEEFGFDEGVFVGDGGRVRTVYLASTSPFAGDAGRPSINDRGEVAFEESLDDFTRGIFPFTGDEFVTIVDERGPQVSAAFNPQLNNAGMVVFHAFLDAGDEAIMTGAGASLTTIADTAHPGVTTHRRDLH